MHQVELIKGWDGLLYIESHEGRFRVTGLSIEPVDSIPESDHTLRLADGSTFGFIHNRVPNRALDVISPNGEHHPYPFAKTDIINWQPFPK